MNSWSDIDIEKLRWMYKNNFTINSIAFVLCKDIDDVRNKIIELIEKGEIVLNNNGHRVNNEPYIRDRFTLKERELIDNTLAHVSRMFNIDNKINKKNYESWCESVRNICKQINKILENTLER